MLKNIMLKKSNHYVDKIISDLILNEAISQIWQTCIINIDIKLVLTKSTNYGWKGDRIYFFQSNHPV